MNTTVSVTTASTLIHQPVSASNLDPQPIIVYNNGSQPVFVSLNEAATTAEGIPIAAASNMNIVFIANEPLRGIVTAGTAEIRVMAMRQ